MTDPTQQPSPQTTGDGQWGGFGGMGEGNGHGGAMACLSGSKPILVNCTFQDNGAYGGIGGNGGSGGNSGGGTESWGGDGGAARGDGQGGAIYCDNQSVPVVRECRFLNNIARSGVPGVGGALGTGNALPDPYTPAQPGSPGEHCVVRPDWRWCSLLWSADGGRCRQIGIHGEPGLRGIRCSRHERPRGRDPHRCQRRGDLLGARQYDQRDQERIHRQLRRCALRRWPGRHGTASECRFKGNEVIDRSLTDYAGYLGSTISFVLVNGVLTPTQRRSSRVAPFTWERTATASR